MKNKYKFIEYSDTNIVCDNESCDYETENVVLDSELSSYVGLECPKCGDNLLTEYDYRFHRKFKAVIRFFNVLFFPWMLLRGGKKESEITTGSLHYHNGKTTIEIDEEESK